MCRTECSFVAYAFIHMHVVCIRYGMDGWSNEWSAGDKLTRPRVWNRMPTKDSSRTSTLYSIYYIIYADVGMRTCGVCVRVVGRSNVFSTRYVWSTKPNTHTLESIRHCCRVRCLCIDFLDHSSGGIIA